MSTPSHPAVDRVARTLAHHGLEPAIVWFDDAVTTAQLAADALGVEVGQIANSLVFTLDGEPILVLTSGAHRVDTDWLGAQLGGVIGRASKETVKDATGQVIGGVAPVGHPSAVRTFVDVDLARYDEVWAAAGHAKTVFPTTFDELVRITGGTPHAVEAPRAAATTGVVAWPRVAGPLELRTPTRDDLERVLEWRNGPEVTRWLLRTTIDPEAYVAAWLESIDDPDQHAFLAAVDGAIVGTGSLDVRDGMGQVGGDAWRRSEGLLGYMIDPAHAGKGYATDIARALLDLAFTELGLHRVTAGCFADNRASWRVMEKVGMRREQHGVRDSWHAELGWVDGFTYAILAEEWHPTN